MRPLMIAATAVAGTVGAACSSLYVHQSDQYAAAQRLVETAQDALADDDSLWSAMESNVEAFAPVERLAIERAVQQGKQTDRRRLSTRTWEQLRVEVEVQAEDWGSELEGLAEKIEATGAKISAVAAEIQSEKAQLEGPGGEGGEGDGEGPATRASELLDHAETMLAQVAAELKALELPSDFAADFQRGIDIVEEYFGFAGKIGEAVDDLESSASKLSQEGWPLDKLLEVLRNVDDLELIRDLVEGATFSETATISKEYKNIREILDSEEVADVVTSVQELRKTLSEIDAGTELIRLRLRRDMTTSRVESLQVDLAHYGAVAKHLQERADLLAERLRVAQIVINFVENGKNGLDKIKLVTVSGETRSASKNDEVYMVIRHLVDSLRHHHAQISVPDASDDKKAGAVGPDYNTRLNWAAFALQAASAYVRLYGDLAVRDSLSKIALARAEHVNSIRRSRVTSRAWQRLLMNGAQGIEAYWAGGVAPEDVAIIALLVAQVTSTTIGVSE